MEKFGKKNLSSATSAEAETCICLHLEICADGRLQVGDATVAIRARATVHCEIEIES